jgi:hypothetical protein
MITTDHPLFYLAVIASIVVFLNVVALRFRMLAFRGAGGEPRWKKYEVLLLRLQEKQHRSKLPRRMPCEKNTQVAGTLLPQDKEGNGRIISHEENVNFIFEESRTLHCNQPTNEGMFQKYPQKQQSFRKQH